MRFERSAAFNAPPERVWAVLSDWDRQASWMPDVAWMRLLGPERELGARLQVRTRVFGIPFANDMMTVTVWDPPRRLAIEHIGVVVGYGEWRLERAGDGTTFTWEERIKMRPKVMGDVALWVYSPWQRWMLGRSIRNLKRLVEASE